jgi:hypothetical protein
MCINERELRDVKTGEIVVLCQNHTFFFVNIKFWPYILVVLGAAFYAAAEAGKL